MILLIGADFFTYEYAFVRDFGQGLAWLSALLRTMRGLGLAVMLIAAALASIPLMSAERRVPWQRGQAREAWGGLLAALSSGQWQIATTMGETYASFFGSGPVAWLVLFVGGMCVGVGTQMAGGCTLGHGITGNSSLQLGSLTATAAFFGTAVVASFLFMVLL
jgi:uncharacterized membrane protein YedE/YeeE